MTPYIKFTDNELATLLSTGDEIAFKVIYQKYWDKLIAIAGKRLEDIIEAEEIVQDIFLNLWRRKANFELKQTFDHYFAVAVKFEIINRLAKRARERERNKLFSQGLVEGFEPMMPLDLRILQKQLEETISSLPPKCQLVFRMSRESGLNNKKIAEQLNISEKAVEKHITQALKKLKSRFGILLPIVILLFPDIKH